MLVWSPWGLQVGGTGALSKWWRIFTSQVEHPVRAKQLWCSNATNASDCLQLLAFQSFVIQNYLYNLYVDLHQAQVVQTPRECPCALEIGILLFHFGLAVYPCRQNPTGSMTRACLLTTICLNLPAVLQGNLAFLLGEATLRNFHMEWRWARLERLLSLPGFASNGLNRITRILQRWDSVSSIEDSLEMALFALPLCCLFCSIVLKRCNWGCIGCTCTGGIL